MGRAIAIATPIFFALIGFEYSWGRAARPQHLSPQRRRQQPESRRPEPALEPVHAAAARRPVCDRLRHAARSGPAGRCVVGMGARDSSRTTSATTGTIASDTRARSSGRRTSSITRARSSISRRHCVRPAAARCWAGCSTCRWRCWAIPPQVFAVAALIDLLYQYWIHTEHIGRLGWFDRILATPSNHRVHHAVNDRYVDRNYGGILIIWDRLFGSFEPEAERCVYGTRAPLDSWDPIWANLEVYARPGAEVLAGAALARQSRGSGSSRRAGVRPGADPSIWPATRFAAR